METWKNTIRLVWFFSGLTLGSILMTWSVADDDSIVIEDEVSEINEDPAVVEDVAKEVQHLTKAENKYKEKLPRLSRKYTRDTNRRDKAVDVIQMSRAATVTKYPALEPKKVSEFEQRRTIVQPVVERPKPRVLTAEEKRRMKEAIQRAKIESRIEEQAHWRDSDREALRRNARR